jgi:hypothetical protein
MIKKALYSCLILLLIGGVASAQVRKWRAPTYQGLVLGKSKKANVARTFGKPVWSGHPEDEFDHPVASLLSYEYENVGGFEGRTVVMMNRRTGVVESISLSVSYQKPLPLGKALEKYGSDYIERESALGPCPTAKEIRNFKPPAKREYPVFFVYPQKGMYISVEQGNNVREITYMLRCH